VAGHISTLEGPSDGELISAVRGGDVDAYGELFARHVEAARRLARQLVSAGDAEDLVSEAFAKVLVVLQRGGGPDLAFRAYLLTAVRRLQVDRFRSTARLQTTGDLTPFDPGVPFRDTAVEGFESAAAARAFASLPERWQLVLWHTEVEGQKPAEVALLLGMTANSVSALAYRAREGLRQAYLSMHAQDVDKDACARTRASLGAYVRGGLSRRDSARVEEHLEDCRACAAIYLELTEVNSRLGALLAPLLLGGVAAAYVGAASGGGVAAATGTVTVLFGRVRDVVAAHAPTAAVAGVAASAVMAGLFVTIQRSPDLPMAEDLPSTSTSAPDAPPTASPSTDPSRRSRTPAATSRGVEPAVAVPSTDPTSGPTAPTADPTTGPTTDPTTPPPTTPPTSPPSTSPPSAPPQSPAVQLAVTVSAGPGGVDVGVTGGIAGLPPLPPVAASVPLPATP
jgi:RNA polymerase sigma factor (sigma-70 family)